MFMSLNMQESLGVYKMLLEKLGESRRGVMYAWRKTRRLGQDVFSVEANGEGME
jgi:hypothetical protein